uniref:Ribosomal protein L22 n=1 Tax=Spumella sp. NIES-1846 TaxID=2490549 RepID=A0A455RGS4_9STRA|nr:hypothetical protein [Spumella sp. NIES-1846]
MKYFIYTIFNIKQSQKKNLKFIKKFKNLSIINFLNKLKLLNLKLSIILQKNIYFIIYLINKNFQIKKEHLWLSNIYINKSSKLKRSHIRAKGEIVKVEKHFSHLTFNLKYF